MLGLAEYLEGWYPHIFMAKLIHSKVNCAKRASANLLLDQVLVDSVFRTAIV